VPPTAPPATPPTAPPATPSNPADRYGFKSHAVLDAVNSFVISERKLHEAYANGVTAARDRLLADLDAQQKRLTRDNNLEEAARVGAAIDAIKAGDLPTQELSLMPAPSMDKQPPVASGKADKAVEASKRSLAGTRWTHSYTIDKFDKNQLARELREFDMTLHADGSLTMTRYNNEEFEGTWSVSPDKPDHVILKWKSASDTHDHFETHTAVIGESGRVPLLLDIQGKAAYFFVGNQ
jgi:hypothetical protein